MNINHIPQPIGIEVIKNKGETYTLDEIIHIKKKVNQVIFNARKKVTDQIDLNNLLDYTILYEYYQYNNLIHPDNLLQFFSYILELYSNAQKDLPQICLTKKEFNNLNCIKYSDCNCYFNNTTIEKKDTCPICIKKFKSNSKVLVLDCKHIFHKKCLSTWLITKSNTCPMCKQEVH